jgi:hypothetical protein
MGGNLLLRGIQRKFSKILLVQPNLYKTVSLMAQDHWCASGNSQSGIMECRPAARNCMTATH